MSHEFKVGHRVRLVKTIIEHPSGDTPGGTCGNRGDVVVVRKISDLRIAFPISVSHEDRTDNSFAVSAAEIELIEGAE